MALRVRTHAPRRVANYQKYRPCLRLELDYRCAYCGASEWGVAPGYAFGAFEIDHHRPVSVERFRALRSTYSNLLWACKTCNRAKGDRWPSDEEVTLGYYMLDPFQHDLAAHWKDEGERRVALTEAATYTIEVLNLNSEVHRSRRNATKSALDQYGKMQSVLAQVPYGPERELIAARLDVLFAKLSGPWDPVQGCLCQMPPRAVSSKETRAERKRRRGKGPAKTA